MEVGIGLDAVKFAAFDQRTEHSPSMAAAIAAGEEMVLAAKCNRPDRPLDRVGIKLDATIMQETGQSLPSRERIADRFGQGASAGCKGELGFEPEPHGIDNGLRTTATCREPVRGRLTANVGFDGIEFGDPAQSASVAIGALVACATS